MENDKLMESIIKGCEHDGSFIPVNEVKRLMHAYHEAKVKEVLIGFIEWQLPSVNQKQKNNRYKAVIEYLKQRNNG